MKQLVAILSIVAICAGLFMKIGLMANYAVQYDKYNELCENKDNPAMECHGSCLLSQEMSTVDTTQSKPVLHNLTSLFIPLFFEDGSITLKAPLYTENTFARVCCWTIDGYSTDVDHPPQHT